MTVEVMDAEGSGREHEEHPEQERRVLREWNKLVQIIIIFWQPSSSCSQKVSESLGVDLVGRIKLQALADICP